MNELLCLFLSAYCLLEFVKTNVKELNTYMKRVKYAYFLVNKFIGKAINLIEMHKL